MFVPMMCHRKEREESPFVRYALKNTRKGNKRLRLCKVCLQKDKEIERINYTFWRQRNGKQKNN